MKPDQTLQQLLIDWYGDLVDCYRNDLSEAERTELARYEASPEFTRTSDWPGWKKHLRKQPGSSDQPRRRTA
jgi:hypothetical protein